MGSLDIKSGKNSRRTQGRYLSSLGLAFMALFCGHETVTAASASATLGVTVRVVKNCSVSTTSLDYEKYNPTLTQATRGPHARTYLSAACAEGSEPAVSIGFGNQSDTSVTSGSMSNGMAVWNYEIPEQEPWARARRQSVKNSLRHRILNREQTMIFPLRDRRPASQTPEAKNNRNFYIITIDF